jgi:hypothetical protein
MSGIRTRWHPSFDALSSHADSSTDAASSTRIGRHVSSCPECGNQVAEIHALGHAARAMTVAGAPPDLWARIEAAASASAGSVTRPQVHLAPADLSPPLSRRHRALALGATMLLTMLAIVALWPRPASLQAAGPSRLTFSPARPVPGGELRVRYQPLAADPKVERLVLVGRFARPAGLNPSRSGYRGRAHDQLADSLGELVPTADGSYVGRIRLPADFLAVSLTVLDPRRDGLDIDGAAPWMVIGGAPDGTPSLASYLAAQDTRTAWLYNGWRSLPRQGVDVADSLKRYFPAHPAGWAFTQSYGMSRGRFDLLRFFESAERKYAAMNDALWPQPSLDAERLHDMVAFARTIDEPWEAVRWAGRLAAQHPEDSRALADLAVSLHEIELRPTPAVGDSIRRWLPVLDQAYRRGPVPNAGYVDALHLAVRYGDSSTRALWTGRETANVAIANVWAMTARLAVDSADQARSQLRRHAEDACTLPPGRLPLASSVDEWRIRCELDRAISYSFLSSLTLRTGLARQALTEADSATVAMRRAEICALPHAHRAHALAALALGDTATALSDFVLAAAGYPSGVSRELESAEARLGGRFDRNAVAARLEEARRTIETCNAELRPRRQARARGRAG